jgi:hypothetical protein
MLRIMKILTAQLLLAVVVPASAEPLPVPKVGSCPAGYRESGGYCAPTAGTKRDAIPKQGQCPSGWITSGAYCLGPERRR